MNRTICQLTGVPETALWTLYDRATEARRPNGLLRDPDAVRICDAIDYDYLTHFGLALGSHAARAAQIDSVLRHWLTRHPEGTVVSLGEGLETQALRVDNGRMHWLSVDLPEMLEFRARFLPPVERRRHHAGSALDTCWLDRIDATQPVFIVAQGLLMYLRPEEVGGLFKALGERLHGAEMVFDTVPRWFATLTRQGLPLTPFYQVPPMPWGIDPDEIASTLDAWHPRLHQSARLPYGFPRGWGKALQEILSSLPVPGPRAASLVHVLIG